MTTSHNSNRSHSQNQDNVKQNSKTPNKPEEQQGDQLVDDDGTNNQQRQKHRQERE